MDLSCSKYIAKSLEPKVLPPKSHHHTLAILPGGGAFLPPDPKLQEMSENG